MALITIEEAKSYLRVDSSDEDALTGILVSSAEQLCMDVARMSQEQWAVVNGDTVDEDENTVVAGTDLYTETELEQVRSVMKVAVLYALGYLFEHREEADHHALTLTLRSVLFAVREGVNF